MRVLAISGSLRRNANSRALLRAAQELAPAGVTVELYEDWSDLPAYDEDLDVAAPAAVEALRARIGSADALLIATPEYNGSVPGALKNAIDWASRPHGESALVGRPAAVISSSPSPFGGTWAGEHLRRALSLSGAVVVERELAIGRIDEKLADGRLADQDTRRDVAELLGELAETGAANLALAA